MSAPIPIWREEAEPAADAYDTADARALLGRFACSECAKNRDDADRLETALDAVNAQLERAHALLNAIAKTQQRPAERASGLEETPYALALVGFAQALAGIKARIEIYFQELKGHNTL